MTDWEADRKRVHRSFASGWSHALSPDFCTSPIPPGLSLLPFRAFIPRVPPPLTNPVGCLGPVAADGLFFPGAGPARTGSARIWVSGADNLQREIEWSTPITVPGLFLPSSRLRVFEDGAAAVAVMLKTNRRAASPLLRFVIVITGIDGARRIAPGEDERERVADGDCCNRGLRMQSLSIWIESDNNQKHTGVS